MPSLRQLCARFSGLFRRRNLEAEMAEEMRQHLDRRTAEKIAEGLTPTEARSAAQRDFGGVEQVKESARDQLRFVWLEQVARDLRHSLRSLGKARGFSGAVILTLALCIGANTAILSTLYSTLLKPMPFRDAGQLVEIHAVFPTAKLPDDTVSVSEYLAYREHATLLDGVGLWANWSFTLGEDSAPQRLLGARVLADLFQVLGVAPLHGRFFTAEHSAPGQDKVVVLTQTLWETHFRADPAIVGQPVKLAGETFTVVGVAPRAMEAIDARVKLFKPFEYQPPARGLGAGGIMYARIKPGVSHAQAQSQVTALARAVFERAGPEWSGLFAAAGSRIEVVPVRARQVGAARTALLTLQAAGLFVLLLGCANVANLMLARCATQLPEFALRQALGASRGALARRLSIDVGLLATIGAAVGVALAWTGLRLINAYLPEIVATAAPVALDGAIVATIALVSMLAALLIGLLLGWRLLGGPLARARARDSLQAGLRQASDHRDARRTSGMLAIVQVALALILLVGAGLLVRSFAKVWALDAGVDATHLFMARVAQPIAAQRDNSVLWAFEQRLLEQLREIPGIDRASLTTTTLLDNDQMTGAEFNAYKLPGETIEPGPATTVNVFNVMPDFFATLGIRLLEGRDFSAADDAQSGQVVIVDRALAERLFPGRSAIGQKLSIRGTPRPGADWPLVVGVVENARLRGLEGPNPYPFAYNPARQTGALRGAVTVVLRTTAPRADLAALVRAKIREVDPALPILYAGAMDARIEALLIKRRGVLLLTAALAVLALGLAAVGIYGMLAYDVSRRTREIGIRGALGATRGQIVGEILRQGIGKTLAGLALGLVGSLFLTRYLQGLLYEVKPFDPAAFAGVSVLLLAVALLASYLPARQAAKVDPMTALRSE